MKTRYVIQERYRKSQFWNDEPSQHPFRFKKEAVKQMETMDVLVNQYWQHRVVKRTEEVVAITK